MNLTIMCLLLSFNTSSLQNQEKKQALWSNWTLNGDVEVWTFNFLVTFLSAKLSNRPIIDGKLIWAMSGHYSVYVWCGEESANWGWSVPATTGPCPPRPCLSILRSLSWQPLDSVHDGLGQEQSNPETTYPVSGQYELKWTFRNFYLNANFQSVRIIYKLLINLQIEELNIQLLELKTFIFNVISQVKP